MKNVFLLCLMFIVYDSKSQVKTDSLYQKKDTLSITFETNYMKSYIWRGISFGSDDVSQPNINFTYKNFFVNLTSNFNLLPKNLPSEFYSKQVYFDEQDVEIGFNGTAGKLDYQIKADRYTYFYQPTSPSTSEINFKFEYPIYKNFTLFSENVFDLEAYNGAYYNNAGISWDKTKGTFDISAQAFASFGNKAFNEAYFAVDASGILLYGSKIDVTKNFKNFYVRGGGEINLFAKKVIKESTELERTYNFIITLGKTLDIPIFKKKKNREK
jgi:hypothetical protein